MMSSVVIAWFVGFTLLGWFVSYQKGRSQFEGWLLAVLLGPIGLLIEALLPLGDRPRG